MHDEYGSAMHSNAHMIPMHTSALFIGSILTGGEIFFFDSRVGPAGPRLCPDGSAHFICIKRRRKFIDGAWNGNWDPGEDLSVGTWTFLLLIEHHFPPPRNR